MTRPSKARSGAQTFAVPEHQTITFEVAGAGGGGGGANGPAPRAAGRPAPTMEALANSTDHNTIVIRDRAINLRDNLVRVCDGERLERARDLLNRAVAVALGKD